MCITYIAGEISLVQNGYIVGEDAGMFTVCAQLSGGSLSSSVSVTISTLSASAQCKIITLQYYI